MREINKLVYIVLFLSSFQTSLAQSANVLLGNKYEKAESATSRSTLYFSQKNSGSLNSTLEFNGKEINASASFTYLIDGSKVQITYEKDLGTEVLEFDGAASQLIRPNVQGYVNGKWGEVIWTRVGLITVGGISVEGNGSRSKIDKTIIPSQIIGNSIKIGQLEIAQNDFNWEMGWDDAKKSIEQLGEGWRLPTKSEFGIIIKNKSSLLFGGDTYWTSTKYREEDVNPLYYWYYSFDPGAVFGRNDPGAFECNTDKGAWLSVRAVRTIK
jgi:hypothetical protein